MRLNPENVMSSLRRYGIPVSLLVLGGIGSWILLQNQINPFATSKQQPESTPTNPEPLATPIHESSESATPESIAKPPSNTATLEEGRMHPFTQLFYPTADRPANYEDWDCFTIPVGGTSFGAFLIGGEDLSTLTDTDRGVVFKNGITEPPITIDLRTRPSTWNNEVRTVQPGTTACSK